MMRFIILLMFVCSTAWAELPVPPVIQAQTTSTTQYMKDIYDNINIIPTTDTDPNGNRYGRYGQIVRWNNGGVYSLYTCVSSPNGKAWQVVVPATAGIPPGGTTDQVLAKIDATDYNVYWLTVPLVNGGNFAVYTDDFTFYATPPICRVFISGCGGGGGGSGGCLKDAAGGAGGESGHAVINYPYAVTPGNTYNVVVGTGGNGSAGTGGGGPSSATADNGIASSFDALTIPGGQGGSGTGGAGVNGLGGYTPRSLGISAEGRSITANLENRGGLGWGGGGVFGTGGLGNNVPGGNGGLYGGGGGGGSAAGANGGNGAKGIVVVSW